MGTLNAKKQKGVPALNDTCPFQAKYQLNDELDGEKRHGAKNLPGYPCLSLDGKEDLSNFILHEFCSEDLDRLAPRLWWMSKQDSKNISPLHQQRVKKREVIITENPKLHLVWIHDRIFIKPLPEYLLSYGFWKHYLCDEGFADGRSEQIRKAALGYLRSYFYLIQHESDFRMAKDPRACLIPSHVTWRDFCNFSADFKRIEDDDTTERYRYGEIRLTRLNFYAVFLLRQRYFQRIDAQYSAYFAHFYGPMLFIFGILSVILNAMQVEVNVEQIGVNKPLSSFPSVSRGFSIASAIFLLFMSSVLLSILLYKIAREWHYALRDRFVRRKQRGNLSVIGNDDRGHYDA